MITVRIKSKVLISLALLYGLATAMYGCRSAGYSITDDHIDTDSITQTCYYFDVIGDRSLDSIVVGNNDKNPAVRDIFLCRGNENERIISIRPWLDSTFFLTIPPIETIYLEANDIQTGKKGLRIVIRNTDVAPDCIFIDLWYDNTQWIVKRFYLLNTNPRMGMDLFIKHIEIDKPVAEVFGASLECDPVFDIMYEYWATLKEIDRPNDNGDE